MCMLAYRTSLGGVAVSAPLVIADVKPARRGHVLADYRLELQGHMYVSHGWLMSSSDGRLWTKLADYPHPDGPRGYMKYLAVTPELERFLTYDAAREYNARVREDGGDEYDMLFAGLDLDEHLAAARARITFSDSPIRVKVHELYENRRMNAVGRVDFQIGDHMSVIQCPITVKGGTFEVESPEHPDAVRFNPVLLEEPLRREIVAAVRRKIAAMDIVPAYLRIAQQHARSLYGTGG